MWSRVWAARWSQVCPEMDPVIWIMTWWVRTSENLKCYNHRSNQLEASDEPMIASGTEGGCRSELWEQNFESKFEVMSVRPTGSFGSTDGCVSLTDIAWWNLYLNPPFERKKAIFSHSHLPNGPQTLQGLLPPKNILFSPPPFTNLSPCMLGD